MLKILNDIKDMTLFQKIPTSMFIHLILWSVSFDCPLSFKRIS